MTATEELNRWRKIEATIKRLTGTDGWFLSMRDRMPPHLDIMLVSEGCDFATLRRAADALTDRLGCLFAGVHIDYQNPNRGEIGICNVPPDKED